MREDPSKCFSLTEKMVVKDKLVIICTQIATTFLVRTTNLNENPIIKTF